MLFSFFLAIPHSLRDLSSLTRDWTQALSSENAESKLLEQQGLATGGLLSNLYQGQKKKKLSKHMPYSLFNDSNE